MDVLLAVAELQDGEGQTLPVPRIGASSEDGRVEIFKDSATLV